MPPLVAVCSRTVPTRQSRVAALTAAPTTITATRSAVDRGHVTVMNLGNGIDQTRRDRGMMKTVSGTWVFLCQNIVELELVMSDMLIDLFNDVITTPSSLN